MKLSEVCKKRLEAAAARDDGRLSPMAWERHRAALMRRGLIDAQSIITAAGREFLRHNNTETPIANAERIRAGKEHE